MSYPVTVHSSKYSSGYNKYGSELPNSYSSSYRGISRTKGMSPPPVAQYNSPMQRSYYQSTRTTSPLDYKPRSLPPGPGPLDARGKKLSKDEGVRGIKTRHTSRVTDTKSRPVKADHSLTDRHRTYSPHMTLERPRRYGSVSDLSSGMSKVELTDTHTMSSRKYGSTRDLSSPVSVSDRVSVLERKSTSRGVDALPDISRSSRSNSMETSSRVGGGSDTRRRLPDHDSISSVHKEVKSVDANSRLGLVGLRNLGNTCFMNSILQCLSNTRDLQRYCVKSEYEDDINTTTSHMKGALINAFAKLLRNMWKSSSSDSYVSPTEFKSQIAKFAKRFVGYNQQDAQEFLIYLLEGLHEDLNRVKEKKKRLIAPDDEDDKLSPSAKAHQSWKTYLDFDNSKIVDIFVGQLKSSLTCTVCHYESNTFDPFWDLSLPIKKSRGYGSEASLDACFDLFTQQEVLDGDEKPTCAKCKQRQRCTKSFSIQKFPRVLIIHLKRFNQETFVRSKLSTLITYPIKSLDLTSYAAEKSGVPIVYSLYAVCNHSGTPYGGHYTSYVRHPTSGDWHHFNDTRVNSVSERSLVTSEGYVLFYELSSSSSSSSSRL